MTATCALPDDLKEYLPELHLSGSERFSLRRRSWTRCLTATDRNATAMRFFAGALQLSRASRQSEIPTQASGAPAPTSSHGAHWWRRQGQHLHYDSSVAIAAPFSAAAVISTGAFSGRHRTLVPRRRCARMVRRCVLPAEGGYAWANGQVIASARTPCVLCSSRWGARFGSNSVTTMVFLIMAGQLLSASRSAGRRTGAWG